MKFKPKEVLFSPTTDCNLRCGHCMTEKKKKTLSEKSALKFLSECKDYGIKKVGFTGGEPFLALSFLCEIVRKAVKEEMFFDRTMTNGVWWKTKTELKKKLYRLFNAGYDGAICVSIDAFHKQSLEKLKYFIKTASSIWGRNDLISAACISGCRDIETKQKLKELFNILGGSFFINTIKIDLSPIGRAGHLKDPWDGSWFKEDYCRGPGNALFVMPDGSVKPCCGYAADMEQLTIGNIKYDSADKIIKNAEKNRFVYTIFNSGLNAIRKRLQKIGFKFPGKTSNHCYFCWYILQNIPRKVLFRCLD